MPATTFATALNNVSTKLGQPYGAGSGSLVLTPGAGTLFPPPSPPSFYVVSVIRAGLANQPSLSSYDFTIFKVDGVAGDTLSLAGTLEGTVDHDYAVGDVVEMRMTAGYIGALQAAVNGLEVGGGGGAVSSVFTRTGAVVAAAGDYGVGQVSGAAPLAAPTFTGLVRLPSTVTINTAAYTWPSAVAASSGYVLACSSAGVLSWVAPSGGGGGMAIGGVVGGGTAGRVLYEGAGAVLADSANLTFNGTKLATTGDLEVDGSIFQGATRLIHTYGTENLFVGLDAGNVTMSGSYNVAFGAGSLLNNTTGNQNVALGRIALASNTTGSLNMAMGCNALYSNTAGAANVGIGNQALTTNATGSNNVALGNSALTDPPASSDNIAIGSRALPNGGIGDQNIGIGSNAGNFCRTSDNVLIGHTAFYSLTTGSDNVGIGWCSGRNITTGGFNVFVGANAGFGAATIGAVTGGATVGYNTQLGGNYSTAVGYGAVCTSQYSVALGANVTAAIDHQVVLGTAAETVVLPGGKIVHRTAVSNNYSITATDYLLGVTSTAAAYTLTLPTATGVAGQAYIIKDESGGAATNNITLTTTSAQTIDGAANKKITAAYGTLKVYSNGTNWFTY